MSSDSSGVLTISVVVPTRGRKHLLRKCLQSLLAQDYPYGSFEIIVVEDGTQEGPEVIASLADGGARIRYQPIPQSGPATAYDVGLDLARFEVVAFIDDDAVADAHWLQRISAALTRGKDQKVAAVGGRVSPDYPGDELQARLSHDGALQWTGSNVVVSAPEDVDFLPGANMAVWRHALMEIGGFDRNFSKSISWRHETDVGRRLRARGYRLLYDSSLLVFHRSARWQDPLERVRPRVVWAMTRDDGYFRAKNFGWKGVGGAARAAVRAAGTRLLLGFTNLLLLPVHLVAWIPGAWRGLRRTHR